MDGIRIEHPGVVRRAIAEEWLRAEEISTELGAVTLRPHQLDAAQRLRVLLADAGGALLCDEVGLGKTYVALAVARAYGRTLVIAPASLREMWHAAAARSAVPVLFASTESLSRGVPAAQSHDLVIVDEAHHFRTPSTARHRSLAALTARSAVLLLSATPLHNRAADLTALLSLFLGSAARALPSAEIARYLVRRRQHDLGGGFPRVRDPAHLQVPHDIRQLEQLLAIPPPTPARNGGIAAAMVAHTLVRLWASSDAALREGLRRRLAKTVAIRASLEAGHYPSARELEAWTYGEGSVQLGFASILSPARYEECGGLLDAAEAHERALVQVLATLRGESIADTARAAHVRALRRRHDGARIVAFSQFAETVGMLYRRLARDGGVAMLTSRGARIASGPIARQDALDRFAPLARNATRSGPGNEISLLIATDLLSEGVNLQDASVVVHLDLPWTAATLEQRVGRVVRLGSRHPEVFVYAIDPPMPGRDLLRTEAIIRRKAGLADATVGASRIPPLFARAEPARRNGVEDAEAIRRMLIEWRACRVPLVEPGPVVATIAAERSGLLALASVRGRLTLIAGWNGQLSAGFRTVRELAEATTGEPVRPTPAAIAAAIEQTQRWIDAELAADDAGDSHAGHSVLAPRLSARLAQELAACPRHERALRSARIAALNSRIQSPFTLGIEREIEDLLRRTTADQDFVAALEQIIGAGSASAEAAPSKIRAMVLFQRWTGRS